MTLFAPFTPARSCQQWPARTNGHLPSASFCQRVDGTSNPTSALCPITWEQLSQIWVREERQRNIPTGRNRNRPALQERRVELSCGAVDLCKHRRTRHIGAQQNKFASTERRDSVPSHTAMSARMSDRGNGRPKCLRPNVGVCEGKRKRPGAGKWKPLRVAQNPSYN